MTKPFGIVSAIGLAAFLIFTGPARAAAPDAATLAAAHALLVTMHSEKLAAQMLDVIGPQVIKVLTEKNHVDRNKALAAWHDVLEPAMKSHVGELTDALAEIYAEHFSAAELADIEAFYHTPTGAKLVERQPLIGSESFKLGQAWGRRIAQDAFQKSRDELQKRGITL